GRSPAQRRSGGTVSSWRVARRRRAHRGNGKDEGMPIDLNSDLGEGMGSWSMGDDGALLSVVTSANVACGFHAGDPPIMRQVTAQAAALRVAVGAHVAYRDHAGFGRRFIDMEPTVLTDEVIYQIGALDGMARRHGHRVTYVKPHG